MKLTVDLRDSMIVFDCGDEYHDIHLAIKKVPALITALQDVLNRQEEYLKARPVLNYIIGDRGSWTVKPEDKINLTYPPNEDA